MSRRRIIIPIAIVLFWVIMMGLLVRRDLLVRYASGSGGGGKAYDTWMSIYPTPDSESSIGFAHMVSIPEIRDGAPGVRLELTVKLAVALLSVPTEIVITGYAWNPNEGGLSEFDFKVRSFDHVIGLRGEVGAGSLKITVNTAGENIPYEFPIGKDLFLSGSMGTTAMNLPFLEVGDEIIIDAFDPLTLTVGKARVKCIGIETIESAGEMVQTRIMTTVLSGVSSKFWVTSAEEMVRMETPFGFTLRKVTQEQALSALDSKGATELIDMIAIRPKGKTMFRGARRVELRLAGLPPNLAPPTDALQRRLEDGRYVIEQPVPPADESGTAIPEDLAKHLEGGPFVQVGHPRIQQKADEITGGMTDPWEKATAIYEWVYKNVKKTIVLSFPSALEVLDTQEGDCNEHTVLYAALARSVGIPTRIAIGVVWSEALRGMYYHAWPEVYIGGWIAMDPTLGQPLADATHLKLLTGNIEAWPQLVPYLGQLQVEVLDVE